MNSKTILILSKKEKLGNFQNRRWEKKNWASDKLWVSLLVNQAWALKVEIPVRQAAIHAHKLMCLSVWGKHLVSESARDFILCNYLGYFEV